MLLKDHKILHFIRILSMYKVKALMGEPDFLYSIYKQNEKS